MGLDIWFREDIRNALAALDASNRRALTQAIHYGMNREAAALYEAGYVGALSDVAASFDLALGEPMRDTLTIPTVKGVITSR